MVVIGGASISERDVVAIKDNMQAALVEDTDLSIGTEVTVG